ncbi:MAG: hypothetical protein U9N62_13235 [Thermotogota bacterium]|nr:hypothetical protein [Thermotogota bacterium]
MPYKQQFTDKVYYQFTDYLSKRFGMECKMNKRQMLQSKIDSFMRMNQIDSYDKLLDFLKSNEDTEQWNNFVHKITTHKTDFFRENQHFVFLKEHLPLMMQKNRRIMIMIPPKKQPFPKKGKSLKKQKIIGFKLFQTKTDVIP